MPAQACSRCLFPAARRGQDILDRLLEGRHLPAVKRRETGHWTVSETPDYARAYGQYSPHEAIADAHEELREIEAITRPSAPARTRSTQIPPLIRHHPVPLDYLFLLGRRYEPHRRHGRPRRAGLPSGQGVPSSRPGLSRHRPPPLRRCAAGGRWARPTEGRRGPRPSRGDDLEVHLAITAETSTGSSRTRKSGGHRPGRQCPARWPAADGKSGHHPKIAARGRARCATPCLTTRRREIPARRGQVRRPGCRLDAWADTRPHTLSRQRRLPASERVLELRPDLSPDAVGCWRGRPPRRLVAWRDPVRPNLSPSPCPLSPPLLPPLLPSRPLSSTSSRPFPPPLSPPSARPSPSTPLSSPPPPPLPLLPAPPPPMSSPCTPRPLPPPPRLLLPSSRALYYRYHVSCLSPLPSHLRLRPSRVSLTPPLPRPPSSLPPLWRPIPSF